MLSCCSSSECLFSRSLASLTSLLATKVPVNGGPSEHKDSGRPGLPLSPPPFPQNLRGHPIRTRRCRDQRFCFPTRRDAGRIPAAGFNRGPTKWGSKRLVTLSSGAAGAVGCPRIKFHFL